MTVTDLASDTWKFDLSEPDDISVAYVTQWYRVHIGDLNNLINQGFYINSAYEIIDENGTAISEDVASIYKKIFEIYYFKKQSKSFLGANGIDSISQVSQDGIVFRGIERNGIAKSYNELYKEAKNELKNLVNNYKFNRATGQHVVGDDTIENNSILDDE